MTEIETTPNLASPPPLEDFLSLDPPEGYRAELIDGEIILRPLPDGNHDTVLSEIIQQFYRRTSASFELSFRMGLAISAGRLIPDLAVWAEGILAGKPPWAPTEGALLVAEITSGDPYWDREVKRRHYAAAEIPLYLLVDRQQRTVVLHSDPDSGGYLTVRTAPYGKDVPLPAPFNFAVETSRF